MPRFISIALLTLFLAARAHAYVDLAPTLAKVIKDAPNIAVAEVAKFSRDNGAVVLKKVRDLKGSAIPETLRHAVATEGGAVPQPILAWAEPGRRAILFNTNNLTLVCIGHYWYQVVLSTEGWWKIAAPRTELPLAYCGSVSRLSDAVEAMLQGKDAIITTLPHGADDEGASFDVALNRAALPGLIKVQRMRANLRMPLRVISVSVKPQYLIGSGPAGEEEIPALIAKLSSPDSTVRAEAADDLRWLGPRANAAVPALEKLLADPAKVAGAGDAAAMMPPLSAAAALLQITAPAPHARALAALERALTSDQPLARRQAARMTGLAGSRARPLAAKLAAQLKDADEFCRLAALEAIATLGPDAADARDALVPLLDEPALIIAAADALGRIGPVARPVLPRLARLLADKEPTVQWAAVRAMAQIGGEGAAPAVEFMVQKLKAPTEVEGYNSMVYLCLLGQVARPALPTLETLRIKNRALRQAAIWSIEPETRFPWLDNDRLMLAFREADWQRFVFDAVLRETGDHFRPAAKVLAQKIMDGTSGEIPTWGYKLLAHFSADVIDTFKAGLAHADLVQRQRATVALGYMGGTASPARDDIARLLASAPTDREKRLLRWCLKRIDAATANGATAATPASPNPPPRAEF